MLQNRRVRLLVDYPKTVRASSPLPLPLLLRLVPDDVHDADLVLREGEVDDVLQRSVLVPSGARPRLVVPLERGVGGGGGGAHWETRSGVLCGCLVCAAATARAVRWRRARPAWSVAGTPLFPETRLSGYAIACRRSIVRLPRSLSAGGTGSLAPPRAAETPAASASRTRLGTGSERRDSLRAARLIALAMARGVLGGYLRARGGRRRSRRSE